MSHTIPPTQVETAPDSLEIDQRLYVSTVAVIERLLDAIDEDSIDKATLSQRVTALGVLCRVLKQFETAQSKNQQPNEEVIRIEYQDSQGRIGGSPPWAAADPERASPLPGSGLWASLWKDRAGQDSTG